MGLATAASAATISLRAELASGMRSIAAFDLGCRRIDIAAGRDSIWAIIRRPGRGGVALRMAHCWGGCTKVTRQRRRTGERIRLSVDSAIGVQTVILRTNDIDLSLLRVTTTLIPATALLVPYFPRDLYPLGDDDDPMNADGRVEAAQRGLNAGLCYFHLDEPSFGSVLYLQNLTALNDYFAATDTKPDAAVGGEWPELGYLPPTPPQSGTPPTNPLPAGKTVTMSDALLVFHDDSACDEQDSARRFLQLLGAAYRQIDPPTTEYRDWVWRAGKTLHDLETAPEATIRHYGHTYIHPYTASEYPDIMVQMSIVAALRDYAAWTTRDIPFGTALENGLGKFHDRTLKTMRRYLPNVGKDKDKLAVDSWYLYHPLLNLGHLALDGDARAKRLFNGSLGLAVKAARHFHYAWPIQFKVDSFDVIVEARNDDGLGQTDVGGIYAYVMVQAYELTGEQSYLLEARRAIDAAKDMRFELNYQANLTAWGAAACMRLWRITDEEYYLHQGYVYLASFFHNCVIWESEIANASKYKVFLGATCLHDAPYMAIFECFDSFAAFERYLKDSGPDLDPAVRLLVSEYCKYALDRAWFYYPDALPADVLAKDDIRNGHIDRTLSFPVEDLYVDGQPAGQVGQEIYGAGAAFVFASRSFHQVEGAPFRIFCDHFPVTSERASERSLRFGLDGGHARQAVFSLVRLPRQRLPRFTLRTMAGERLRPHNRTSDLIEYRIPASGEVSLQW
ncbi:hypothetical protein [Sphingobium sp. CECT 9361]|uniref:hypothetical protein n=1 Tax=Sphingobium sp. CECT 9361 TaxID=2845384 RepID=UPI001E5F044A|nr:hypothetical protein [Sphingobium sp. CECT 9361]CAH0357153.1 hypothetical protein SPH9361_04802 [Sphingobium sp. CECT 9361]